MGAKGAGNHLIHGHYKRKTQLEAISLEDIDKRSAGGEQIWKRRQEFIEHCGGVEMVSAVLMRTIEHTCFTEYLLSHVDFYLLTLGPRIINRKKRQVVPVMLERNRMIEVLTRLYEKIGYQPTARPLPTLADYMRQGDEISPAASNITNGSRVGTDSTDRSSPGSLDIPGAPLVKSVKRAKSPESPRDLGSFTDQTVDDLENLE